jgi:hypothetical protein
MSFDLKIISGDLSIKNGDVQKITDNDKLIQDLLKICVTPAGSNPLQPWYGSLLSKTMIGSPMKNDMILQISKIQLENALQNLKSQQERQSRQFQNMSPFEQINYIQDISISRSSEDYRLYKVRVTVLSKGLKSLTTTFDVTTI